MVSLVDEEVVAVEEVSVDDSDVRAEDVDVVLVLVGVDVVLVVADLVRYLPIVVAKATSQWAVEKSRSDGHAMQKRLDRNTTYSFQCLRVCSTESWGVVLSS